MGPTTATAQIRIGCSGWLYKDWRGTFYPRDLPQSGWLAYYASQFDTVEINNTFYRLPEGEMFAEWHKSVPGNFLYAVKASRYLTHMKKLKDPAEPLDRLFSRARRLGRALGPVVYQLPPHWRVDVERLERFLRLLPKGRQHVIEFREPSWYTDEVFALLAYFKVAICLHDMAGSATKRMEVGPFVYVRFHGVPRYSGRYENRTLECWADWLAAQVANGRRVYAYFNNTIAAQAPRDAIRLRDELMARANEIAR